MLVEVKEVERIGKDLVCATNMTDMKFVNIKCDQHFRLLQLPLY